MGRGARARRAAALRGRGGRRRAGHPRAAGVAGRRPRRPPARDRQRDDELHPHAHGRDRRLLRRRAGRGAGAGLRRGRPDRGRQRQGRGGQDGDPRAAGLRHAGAPRPGALRGHRAHHRRRHGVRARARARAQAHRHRRARRRRAQRPRAPGLPLRRPPAGQRQRPVQRGDDRVAGDHRDHAERPGRRRPADGERRPGRRHQRDDPARLDARDDRRAGHRQRRRVGLLPAPRGRRPPRRAGPDRPAARAAGRVDPLGGPEGAGRERAPGHGHPPAARVAVLRRAGADRRPGLHARAAARDPRHRRGVPARP